MAVPRPLRIQYPGAWYHVVNRGASKRSIFLDTNDRVVFLELLAMASQRCEAEVHAYCLMGNHCHLLVQTPRGNLSQMMHLVGLHYSRYFNDKYRKDGRLCKDRYYPILIDSDRYLLAVSRYIHRNPTAFGVESLAGYFWSSYAAYLGLRRPQDWLHTEFTLDVSGGLVEYERLVESVLPSEVDRWYEAERLPLVVGSPDFRRTAVLRAKVERTAS